jgi:hypothetical protein
MQTHIMHKSHTCALFWIKQLDAQIEAAEQEEKDQPEDLPDPEPEPEPESETEQIDRDDTLDNNFHEGAIL